MHDPAGMGDPRGDCRITPASDDNHAALGDRACRRAVCLLPAAGIVGRARTRTIWDGLQERRDRCRRIAGAFAQPAHRHADRAFRRRRGIDRSRAILPAPGRMYLVPAGRRCADDGPPAGGGGGAVCRFLPAGRTVCLGNVDFTAGTRESFPSDRAVKPRPIGPDYRPRDRLDGAGDSTASLQLHNPLGTV